NHTHISPQYFLSILNINLVSDSTVILDINTLLLSSASKHSNKVYTLPKLVYLTSLLLAYLLVICILVGAVLPKVSGMLINIIPSSTGIQLSTSSPLTRQPLLHSLISSCISAQ